MNGERFKGEVAVVTGAESGIGATTAARLAAEGAPVACLDVNRDAMRSRRDPQHSPTPPGRAGRATSSGRTREDAHQEGRVPGGDRLRYRIPAPRRRLVHHGRATPG